MRSSLRRWEARAVSAVPEPRLRSSATARQEKGQGRRFRHRTNRSARCRRSIASPLARGRAMSSRLWRWASTAGSICNLHPEKIPDNAIEARLAPFRTLRMSSKEIVEEFPDNQMIKQVMDGKRPMPSDPAKRAVYQVQIARLEEKHRRRRRRKQNRRPTPRR